MADTNFEALVEKAGLEEARRLGQQATVDANVVKALPPGTTIIEATFYGISFWTRSLRIQADVPGEGKREYFLKLSSADEAKTMMSGEFGSQQLLSKYAPDFIPRPVSWGVCADKKTYYFLSDFIEMTDGVPEPVEFCARLAELHQKSMDDHGEDNRSDRFGLDTDRCQGNVVLQKLLSDSWCDYFQQAMRQLIDREKVTQGPSPELDKYETTLLDKIIPRLLRPLQEDGRKIKPCLVHGDLWHGNASVSTATGKPFAFDSCAIWAHNEYEMGIWRASRYQFKQPYFREYHHQIPISQPEEDWDMRNILYAVRIDLLCSALYGINQTFRQLALEGIELLIERLGSDYAVDDEEPVASQIEHSAAASRFLN